MLTEVKNCRICNKDKSLTEFYFRKDSLKYRSECNECLKIINKNKHLKNIEKRKIKQRDYRLKNAEVLRIKNLEWRKNNKERIKEYQKEYNKNNREKIKAQRSIHYIENKERINNNKKEHYLLNKEQYAKRRDEYALREKDRLREARRKWEIERLKNDPCYRLSKNLRARVRHAIKGKDRKTSEYLGCSVEEFKLYMEALFKDGMTWENYGTYWHVDHKIPVSWFDLTKPEEAAKAFHYTNSQPLEARENILKNNKFAHV
jgi:hypothetical protein